MTKQSQWRQGLQCRQRMPHNGASHYPLTAGIVYWRQLHRALGKILAENKDYYNSARCHLSLNKAAPDKSAVDPTQNGAKIVGVEYLAGLHHRYFRKAA